MDFYGAGVNPFTGQATHPNTFGSKVGSGMHGIPDLDSYGNQPDRFVKSSDLYSSTQREAKRNAITIGSILAGIIGLAYLKGRNFKFVNSILSRLNPLSPLKYAGKGFMQLGWELTKIPFKLAAGAIGGIFRGITWPVRRLFSK